MPFEGINAMPVNQEFVNGEEISILVRGGDEVVGIVESCTTGADTTILTLLVDGTPTEFKFVSGQWDQIATESAQAEEIQEAA